MMHYARRRASLAFVKQGLPSWSYRFDTVVAGMPGYIGATHFQEVAFVFDNTRGDGYAKNPFGNDNNTETLTALAKTMSTAWVNFVTSQDPNGPEGLGLALPGGGAWPVYNASVGGGVGESLVWTNKGSYVEMDSWRAEALNYFIENSLAVFGF
jgi:carboxylesterase type B